MRYVMALCHYLCDGLTQKMPFDWFIFKQIAVFHNDTVNIFLLRHVSSCQFSLKKFNEELNGK